MHFKSRGLALAIVAAAIVAAAVWLLPLREWLMAVQAYARDAGVTGYFVYAAVYALCVVFFVPATILTVAAGAIFGVVPGTLIVLAGATTGATITFLLSRTLLRERVAARISASVRLSALDHAIATEGAKIVLLIRLAPIFPFTWMNYAFGLTGIATGPYILASFAGMIPGTIAFVYLSDKVATAARGGLDPARLAINVAGGIAALAATLYVARIARKALKEAVAANADC